MKASQSSNTKESYESNILLVAGILLVCVGILFVFDYTNIAGKITGKLAATSVCTESSGVFMGPFADITVGKYAITKDISSYPIQHKNSCLTVSNSPKEITLELKGNLCIKEGKKTTFTLFSGEKKEFIDFCINNEYKTIKRSQKIGRFGCVSSAEAGSEKNVLIRTESCNCAEGVCIV